MSLAHELRVLELESQVELLERLQLLTNFGSNLVTVAGKAGSGRSWLAQRYLEAWSTEKISVYYFVIQAKTINNAAHLFLVRLFLIHSLINMTLCQIASPGYWMEIRVMWLSLLMMRTVSLSYWYPNYGCWYWKLNQTLSGRSISFSSRKRVI